MGIAERIDSCLIPSQRGPRAPLIIAAIVASIVGCIVALFSCKYAITVSRHNSLQAAISALTSREQGPRPIVWSNLPEDLNDTDRKFDLMAEPYRHISRHSDEWLTFRGEVESMYSVRSVQVFPDEMHAVVASFGYSYADGEFGISVVNVEGVENEIAIDRSKLSGSYIDAPITTRVRCKVVRFRSLENGKVWVPMILEDTLLVEDTKTHHLNFDVPTIVACRIYEAETTRSRPNEALVRVCIDGVDEYVKLKLDMNGAIGVSSPSP